eukprot:gene3778-4726_t
MDERKAFYPTDDSVLVYDSLAIRVTVAVLFLCACSSTGAYIGSLLGFDLRQGIVTGLVENLFTERTLYDIAVANEEVDNMDQRLTQDVADTVGGGTSPGVCGAIIGTLACPSGLYSLLSSVVFATAVLSLDYGWIPPCAAGAWIVLAFFSVSQILGKISRLTAEQRKLEGDLRFAHSRIVMHAESIAFYQGQEVERANADKLFGLLYANYNLLLRWNWLLAYTNLLFLGVTPLYIYFIMYLLVENNVAVFETTG